MRRTFVETKAFTKCVDAEVRGLLPAIQQALLQDPESGDLIQGTGGLRKVRAAGRGKGKRGGFRVIYLDLPAVEKIYLLLLYEKGEKDDISPSEKKVLRELVKQLKEESQ